MHNNTLSSAWFFQFVYDMSEHENLYDYTFTFQKWLQDLVTSLPWGHKNGD